MVNARIQNTVPNVGIQRIVPSVRASSFQTTRSGDALITVGMPIGLLLSLTYTANQNPGFYGDYRPTVRIASY